MPSAPKKRRTTNEGHVKEPAITHHDKEIAGDPFISEPASDESGDSQDRGADEDEDEKSTESEMESDNAEGSGPERNRSRARNALLREVCVIIAHLFIVNTILTFCSVLRGLMMSARKDPIKSCQWSYVDRLTILTILLMTVL